MEVVGLSDAKLNERVWPLREKPRMRFNTLHHQTLGYFDLIADSFDKFAERDAGIGISSINVLFCLREADLYEALKICNSLKDFLAGNPNSWRTYLGTEKHPGGIEIKVEPLLFKSRAIRIIGHIESMINLAISNGYAVVFGNGVAYRALCGIPPIPGVYTYS